MDYILNNIEKFNVFSSLTDFFSKYRVFPFLGLASGFALDHDSLLRANVQNQWTSYEKCEKITNIYRENKGENLKNTKLQYKIQWFSENIIPDIDYENKNNNGFGSYMRKFNRKKILRILKNQ